MHPSQTAEALRRIAAKIEASKKPSRELVIKDIQSVLAAMNTPEQPGNTPAK